MISALVPVKQLDRAKSRLLPELDRDAAGRLALAMMEDIVEALRDAPPVAEVGVVTPDALVAACAERAGARPLLLPDPGLNRSLAHAAEELVPAPDAALLVVLGDVPGVRPADVVALCDALDAAGGRGVVLAASADGGTSALLRAPHDVIPPCFGPDSAKAHRRAAREAGVPLRELTLPDLAIDLDRSEDVRAFLARPEGGRRTRELLRALGLRGERPASGGCGA